MNILPNEIIKKIARYMRTADVCEFGRTRKIYKKLVDPLIFTRKIFHIMNDIEPYIIPVKENNLELFQLIREIYPDYKGEIDMYDTDSILVDSMYYGATNFINCPEFWRDGDVFMGKKIP